MDDSQPVLAYYCKFYSVSLALKGGPSGKFQRSPQTDTFLARLFDDLEEVRAHYLMFIKFRIIRRNRP